MDFYNIREETSKDGSLRIFPGFRVLRSKDLMIRGGKFVAIWDEEKGLWSVDEYDVKRLVDAALHRYVEERKKNYDGHVKLHLMEDFGSNSWKDFRKYLQHLSDTAKQLDDRLVFTNTEVKKADYATRRLPYALEAGEFPVWEEIISTLYNDEERAKIEWAIGAIVSGDARKIQKFLVFYGAPGTGKGTVLEIVMKLFQGYYTTFEAKALVSASNAFATEAFKGNPLVAIQHDGDLSKIEDNSKLNSIISHEEILINEKFKPSYMSRVNSFCLMGTNKPVKISDAKSGIIRRLIDVHPSGRLIKVDRYHVLMSQIDFELGAVAAHCLEVYRSMGKDYYSKYRPVEMMLYTDVFYNFVEDHYDTFKRQNGTTVKQAYELYKTWATDTNVEYKLAMFKFRDELKNYFETFEERCVVNGERVRSWYAGFKTEKFNSSVGDTSAAYSLAVDETASLFDQLFADAPAQYATDADNPDPARRETPTYKWDNVKTKLSDIDTSRTHYVKVPETHVVIDFDLKDANGDKSAELNIEAASKWPTTYAEYSKGGAGIHLHYDWTGGDTDTLSRIFADGIEVKVFTGNMSLRRRLSRCNNVPVATLSSGLPLREKKVLNFDTVRSERGLRELIMKNLRKEFHPGTKPSIDFIAKILEDALKDGLIFDVSDMRGRVLAFANGSTNHGEYCIQQVLKMKFQSELTPEMHVATGHPEYFDDRKVFFDIEVFPNLFLVCWKYEGKDNPVVAMINPTPADIEPLLKTKLVGFNNRRYDNHMLYAAYLGYTVDQLYKLSKKLIGGNGGYFGEAYGLAYTDIYDFMSIKKSLKRAQLDMGIHHMELGLDWDKPVDPKLWPKVVEYCGNDVISEEDVFNDRIEDFVARQILADLSGLTVGHTTAQHTAKIIFKGDKRPQEKFEYTDLSEDLFPGYVYDCGKSTYLGIEPGEGGYVYAEPGMYTNVAVLDVESMHPSSLVALNAFGPYTQNFADLLHARLAIKHGDYEAAGEMMGGVLKPYLTDKAQAKALSYALKIIINIVYGLTSAKFDNPFRDPRNKDNIVAKRGALFMVELKRAVEEQGFKVVHIKTDSIKIPNATAEIIEYVNELGKQYGYNFEHETTYEKFCLVNDAVYIAKVIDAPWEKNAGEWTATGAQFAHPYVFKTLFSHEPLVFNDLCEIKTVTTALYLDFGSTKPMFEDDHDLRFVGKAGAFCPVVEGAGGGILLRKKKDAEEYSAATGSKNFLWLESEVVKANGLEKDIDTNYFRRLVDDAIANISKWGDFEQFVGEEGYAAAA